jgi:hypothetical protein
MQIPLWAFLTSIFLALAWKDMASVLVKHGFSSTSSIKHFLPLSVTLSKYLRQPTQVRSFTHSTSKMSSQKFLDTVTARRSYYQLKKESPIDDAKINDIIKQSLLQVPSSFNSQSTRIILLLKDEHEKFWE